MQSAVFISLWQDGATKLVDVAPINVIDEHPGFIEGAEAIGKAVVDIGEAVYHGWTGQWSSVKDDIVNLYNVVTGGSDQLARRDATQVFSKSGRFPGVQGNVATVDVLFRAWSEDDIKRNAFARVDPPDGIDDRGGTYHEDRDDNKFYDHLFSIQLPRASPGEHIFAFSACDDGWFFDVSVASNLSVGIEAPLEWTVISGPRTARVAGSIKPKHAGPRPGPKRLPLTLAQAHRVPSPLMKHYAP